MDLDAVPAIGVELGPHERLIWAGRPRRGLLLHPSDALIIPFGLLWLAFASYGAGSALAKPGPLLPQLLNTVFVLVGLYVIAGRFVFDALHRGRTFYGVTTERVLIIRDLFGRTVTALDLRALGDVTVTGKGDAGTISFGAATRSGGWSGRSNPPTPRFEGVPDAKGVYEIIRRAQADV